MKLNERTIERAHGLMKAAKAMLALRCQKVDEAIKRRKEKSDAYYSQMFKKMDEDRDRREHKRKGQAVAVEVIKVIAEGHYDPRQLCNEWLKEFGDKD